MPLSIQKLVSRLSLRQLQVFQAVYEERGYRKAADRLGLTQPAVSSQVRHLEEVFGEPLFEYIGRTLYCTPAGELVAATTRAVFEQLKNLQADVHALQGQLSGELRLAAVSTAQYVVPHLLQPFLAEHPRLTPVLQVVNRAQALERLAANLDDFVIMGLVPEDKPLSSLPFLDNELVPVASAQHLLAESERVSLADFFANPLLIRESGSGSRLALEQFCEQAQVTPGVFMEISSNDAIKHAILAGLGVGVLPRLSVQAEVGVGQLRVLDVPGFPIRRSWCLVYPRGKHLSPVAEAFRGHIQGNLAAIRLYFEKLLP